MPEESHFLVDGGSKWLREDNLPLASRLSTSQPWPRTRPQATPWTPRVQHVGHVSHIAPAEGEGGGGSTQLSRGIPLRRTSGGWPSN